MNEDAIKISTKQCPVCGILHSHNAEILIHKNLKNIEDTFTGEGLCEEHQKRFDEGYLALVEVANGEENSDRMGQDEAERTGQIGFMRRSLFEEIFGPKIDPKIPLVFASRELIAALKAKVGIKRGCITS